MDAGPTLSSAREAHRHGDWVGRTTPSPPSLRSGPLLVDINASSHVEENRELPWGTYLYTVSLLHCMTVSLSQGGAGLGTAWGRHLAARMLGEAGFTAVEMHDVDTDPFNVYYSARRDPA